MPSSLGNSNDLLLTIPDHEIETKDVANIEILSSVQLFASEIDQLTRIHENLVNLDTILSSTPQLNGLRCNAARLCLMCCVTGVGAIVISGIQLSIVAMTSSSSNNTTGGFAIGGTICGIGILSIAIGSVLYWSSRCQSLILKHTDNPIDPTDFPTTLKALNTIFHHLDFDEIKAEDLSSTKNLANIADKISAVITKLRSDNSFTKDQVKIVVSILEERGFFSRKSSAPGDVILDYLIPTDNVRKKLGML